ncbi:MAG: prepilin-type N-terminal cleavage/methylation domain-containing protein, partial [Actinobacteria bacterium]|nr:prepilin-type N-terminal cleavage/methylation domain-containing protein [Actinomycetota bacterium]
MSRRRLNSGRNPDRGMTLVELLVSVAVLGIVGSVVAAAVIIVFRQIGNTQGRTEVARSEQNVSLWLPADLSSAESVDTKPESTPCG